MNKTGTNITALNVRTLNILGEPPREVAGPLSVAMNDEWWESRERVGFNLANTAGTEINNLTED